MNKFKLFVLIIYYYILYLITPKSILKVLYYATYIYLIRLTGMCCAISLSFLKIYNYSLDYGDIYLKIPEFNNHNAKVLFNAKDSSGFWWNLNDVINR